MSNISRLPVVDTSSRQNWVVRLFQRLVEHQHPFAKTAGVEAKAEPAGHPKYRPDIDGLRAVAVLAVVGFHAFPNWVKGGFVGVDIFFVISGFLISSIIFAQLHTGTFSYLDFYGRRVRRIFPALLVILVVCYIFGWFVLLAGEYKQLGKHIAAGAGFISNLVFRSESGYFDAAAINKPLLHLWSLGIEEQFYIVWPLMLSLLWRRHRLRFGAILLIFAASFLWNIWAVHTDPVADFYTPQTRFWELTIGALLAYLSLFHPSAIGKFKSAQSGLGAVLVVGCLVFTVKEIPFPGWWALLPTLGAALLLSAGPGAWFNRAILANPLAVWLGLISYPLYLWHWPLLSFSTIVRGRELGRSARTGAVIAAVALAWLTYRLIELPVRRIPRQALKTGVLLVLMTLLGGAGLITFLHSGFPFRVAEQRVSAFNRQQLTLNVQQTPQCAREVSRKADFCLVYGNEANVTLAVIGDSISYALTPGLAGIYANDKQGVVNLGYHLCPPIRGVSTNWSNLPGDVGTGCADGVRDTYAYILGHPSIKVVVLAFLPLGVPRWGIPGVAHSDPIEQRIDAVEPLFAADIAALRAAGKRVIVTYDMPSSPVPPTSCMRTISLIDCNAISISALVDREPYQSRFSRFFDQLDGVCVFRQSDLLIKNGNLRMFDADGRLLMRDPSHLSDFGSTQMARLFQASACGRLMNSSRDD
jgi:peptidoglycan/LPS O-acetylase OafA/YrhL